MRIRPTRLAAAALAALAGLAAIPRDAAAQLAPYVSVSNFRNLVRGGDFATNPWQRGTTVSGIAATATFSADGFFSWGNASSSITITKTPTAALLTGFSQALKFQRAAANANTGEICTGQVLESVDAIPLQGRTVTFSVYALAGANFSAAGSQMRAAIVTGTGTDQGSASLAAGTWTGQANAISSLQTITTGFARYSFVAAVPTNAAEVSTQICWTPVGTAGADDSIQLAGWSLEIGSVATEFERRPASVEYALAARYFVRIPEPAANSPVCVGQGISATNGVVYCPMPTRMRTAAASTNSNFGTFQVTIPAGTLQAVTAFGGGAPSAGSPVMCAVPITVAANLVAGNVTAMWGNGGAGFVNCSAEL